MGEIGGHDDEGDWTTGASLDSNATSNRKTEGCSGAAGVRPRGELESLKVEWCRLMKCPRGGLAITEGEKETKRPPGMGDNQDQSEG